MTTDHKLVSDGDIIDEKKKDVLKYKDIYSSQVSKLIRVTNLGLLATIWTLLTTMKDDFDFASKIFGVISAKVIFLLAMLIIVLTLLVDFIQYFAGYKKEDEAYRRLESDSPPSGRIYNRRAKWYRIQDASFIWKIRLTFINTALVLIVILRIILLG